MDPFPLFLRLCVLFFFFFACIFPCLFFSSAVSLPIAFLLSFPLHSHLLFSHSHLLCVFFSLYSMTIRPHFLVLHDFSNFLFASFLFDCFCSLLYINSTSCKRHVPPSFPIRSSLFSLSLFPFLFLPFNLPVLSLFFCSLFFFCITPPSSTLSYPRLGPRYDL
ncbi:hypothetical protein QBC37DRAFT_462569 [Rhypophila decipiens]|uniref:Uncharacterized protein n=1 Tax=Rhypophila decipiens TaxID=261697 RepID=A0AAN7B035_9PEZI|nr:hypothetical protein QBC37DRAFT_462569 [Rhypophila decipiens]